MADYEKISYKEYQFHRGDLIVLAMYGENETIKNISYDCAKYGANIAIFNLREIHKIELEERLKESNAINGAMYIDNVEKPTMENIINKCYELSEKYRYFYIMIDLIDTTTYNEQDLNALKGLCEKLHAIAFIAPDITETEISPDSSDVANKELEDIADVIIVSTDKQATMVKNKYGKTGILDFEEDNDNV